MAHQLHETQPLIIQCVSIKQEDEDKLYLLLWWYTKMCTKWEETE